MKKMRSPRRVASVSQHCGAQKRQAQENGILRGVTTVHKSPTSLDTSSLRDSSAFPEVYPGANEINAESRNRLGYRESMLKRNDHERSAKKMNQNRAKSRS